MPDRMPEDMSDRMPEDMPDRMPEDLPVRKCINVMVGITRSKVILPMPLRMKFCSGKPKRRRQHALSALIVPQHWVSKCHRFRMFL
jgi:hypothetical protein